ncbi:class I SAM-dependent methyltransferase [Lichenicoccus sp.]|uniref:class I SAM-dependent methyltransferase n=1 Tax=Lichenicoccus sp. TaxID=2781899 RepID=UPI003D0F5391
MFDATSAAAYVQALFRFVLNRPSPEQHELEHWSNFLLERQDPVEVLERFGLSVEAQSHRKSIAAATEGFPPGHFYSPIVNFEEVETDSGRLFTRHAPLGVDMNVLVQKYIFDKLVYHSADLPFSDEKTEGLRYYYNNTSYAFGDAFGYWGMLAHLRPARIIEIGSGFTSALALDGIELLGLDTTCTFIDPYPDLLLRVTSPLAPRHRVIADRVQSISPKLVEALEAGDILFIDSSHVVKTGSDVHFELTELLPRLAPGVVVHFHDVFDSFEYPKTWVVEAKQSWNEIYFLQAFLMGDSGFEIIYFNDFFAKEFAAHIDALPIAMSRRIHLNPGGGLWLRRC